MVEIYWKKFNADKHYTQDEIQKMREVTDCCDLTNNDLKKLRNFINSDIRNQNKKELLRIKDKDWNWLIWRLNKKSPETIRLLQNEWVLDENLKLEDTVKAKIKLIQASLNVEGYKWQNNKKLEVDGIFWPNTFWALINYQKKDSLYKSINNWKWDGLVGYRTVESLIKIDQPVVEDPNKGWDKRNQPVVEDPNKGWDKRNQPVVEDPNKGWDKRNQPVVEDPDQGWDKRNQPVVEDPNKGWDKRNQPVVEDPNKGWDKRNQPVVEDPNKGW